MTNAWRIFLKSSYFSNFQKAHDLFSYPGVDHDLELQRQVCRFYALCWMMPALKECKKTVWGNQAGHDWQDT
jgi:hypothetical protein